MSIFNTYRPLVPADVVGQEVATKTVTSQLQDGNLPQVNLFCGVHGCGKTTMARIVAKALNCEHPVNGVPCCQCNSCLSADRGNNPDIIEIDAAANNGVADVDIMIKQVQYVPFYKKKVVILDEVHNLSKAAFDHLLKPVEEPPAHVVFIFCTTEEKKLPSTILSRCTNKIEFRRIDDEEIRNQLEKVCDAEEITYDSESITLLVQEANGSLRDALSALEQVSYGKSLTKDKVLGAFSSSTDEQVLLLLGKVSGEAISSVCGDIADLIGATNVAVFLQNMVSVLLDIINVSMGMDIMHLNGNGQRTKCSSEYASGVRDLCQAYTPEDVKKLLYSITSYLKSGTRELTAYSVMMILMDFALAKEMQNAVPNAGSSCEEIPQNEESAQTAAVAESFTSANVIEPVFDDAFIGDGISSIPEPVSVVDSGFVSIGSDNSCPFGTGSTNSSSETVLSIPGVIMEDENSEEDSEENTVVSNPAPIIVEDDEDDFGFDTAAVRLF